MSVLVGDVLEHGWSPPDPIERVMSLTQVRDYVVILTNQKVWCVRRRYGIGRDLEFIAQWTLPL